MARSFFSKIKDKTDTMSAYLPYESIYYESIADCYKYARNLMIVVFAAVMFFVILLSNQELRPENFRYLFKYIDVDPVAISANYNDIYYDTNDDTFFAFYKGDLAIVGDGKIKLYNIAGNNILDEKLETDNAICCDEGKYLVMYYPGEKNLSVFNSFSKLYSVKYDYPVVSASAGENGSFAVITRDAKYRSVVYIYNSSFKNAYTWKSNEKYAVSAAISPNGKNVAVLTYIQQNGTYLREIAVRNISKDKQMLLSSSEGMMPLKVGFFSNDSMYILHTDGIEFYNKDFEKIKSVSFDDEMQFYNVFSDGIIFVTGKNKSDTTVHYYDTKGNNKLTENFKCSVLDIKLIDGIVYLLTDNEIYRISEKTLAKAEIESGAKTIFLFNDGNVMVCYDSQTKLVKEEDFIKTN
jgi:WD40 repeat protein